MIEISGITATLAQGRGNYSSLAVGLRDAVRLLKCLPHEIASIELHRKSIDARNKDHVHFVLSIRLSLIDSLDEQEVLARAPEADRSRVRIVDGTEPTYPAPVARQPRQRPVVVGAGCAGLFCALALAEAGLEPLLVERGDDARRRTDAIDRFLATLELDVESNIQFGLGGAGTFSDGKLTTGTKNPAHRLILKTFVAAGAPREIQWDAKPHIGSDILPDVVEHIAARIRELGGEVRFRTRLVDIERAGGTSGAVTGVVLEHTSDGVTTTEHIACDRLVLACGHSARDVFELLQRRGFTLARKTFAMGARVEHLQAMIDRAQYGPAAGNPSLGAAPYKLVAHLKGGRSLFTFCMCPGGQVVAATSEKGAVVTNGASLYARDGVNANAALLVNVTPEDLPGDDPLAGIALQRSCERRAFELGGGAYRAPAQLVGDFLAGRPSTGGASVTPTYPLGVTWGALDEALPAYIVETMRRGIPALGRKLRSFDTADAVLSGVESRSSSPVTVVRGKDCQAAGADGLFPCGEGAGYAGGIMSAATDGIRCAEALIASLGATAARTSSPSTMSTPSGW